MEVLNNLLICIASVSYTHLYTVIFVGDLNARVGSNPTLKFIGPHGEPTLNRNGKGLKEFVTLNSLNDLKRTNGYFRKKDIYMYTWMARVTRSIIDYK